MSAGVAYEARQIEPNSQLSCSPRLEPCSRNVFVIGRLVGYTVSVGGRSSRLVGRTAWVASCILSRLGMSVSCGITSTVFLSTASEGQLHFTVWTFFLCLSCSADPGMKEGDVVRYGQHVTLTTLPGVGGQVCILNTFV